MQGERGPGDQREEGDPGVGVGGVGCCASKARRPHGVCSMLKVGGWGG